jgi:hypothetical protein
MVRRGDQQASSDYTCRHRGADDDATHRPHGASRLAASFLFRFGSLYGLRFARAAERVAPVLLRAGVPVRCVPPRLDAALFVAPRFGAAPFAAPRFGFARFAVARFATARLAGARFTAAPLPFARFVGRRVVPRVRSVARGRCPVRFVTVRLCGLGIDGVLSALGFSAFSDRPGASFTCPLVEPARFASAIGRGRGAAPGIAAASRAASRLKALLGGPGR